MSGYLTRAMEASFLIDRETYNAKREKIKAHDKKRYKEKRAQVLEQSKRYRERKKREREKIVPTENPIDISQVVI